MGLDTTSEGSNYKHNIGPGNLRQSLANPIFKACPFCLEEIRSSAIKCRHCGEYVAGNAAKWREFSRFFEGLNPEDRRELLEGMTEQQRDAINKILFAKGKISPIIKLAHPIISAQEKRNLGRFILLTLILLLLAITWQMIYSVMPPSQPKYSWRSPRFDVPIPSLARLIQRETQNPNTGKIMNETYILPMKPRELFEFYKQHMLHEGWLSYGEPSQGRMVFQNGKRWIGIVTDETSGTFTLISPR